MLSYFEFLLENKLTLNLFFSQDLLVLLDKIIKSGQPGSEVAKYLLSRHNASGKRYEITFIDKTNKNDKVSFLQVNRAKRFFDESGDEKIDVWAFNQDYNKRLGRPGKVWKEQRSEITIGKFTNKIYKSDIENNIKANITPKQLEDFVNLYKSYYDLEKDAYKRFEIVSGEEIKKWYLYENYESQRGQLGASCMRHKGCQDYFNIYIQNPEVVSLVILKSQKDDTKITGRALLWTATNGDKILDRIYFINDSDENLFKKFANENGWKTKSNLTWQELDKYEIQLKKWIFDKYPYLDTFAFLEKDDGILKSDEDLWPDQGFWRLQSTSGDYEDDNVVWSEYNGEYINREEAIFCQRREEWVYVDDAIYLEYLEEYAHPYERIVWSEYECQNYYLEDAVKSDILSDWFYEEDVVEIITDSNKSIDFVHIDFSKYLIDIKIDGKSYKTFNILTVELPNGDTIFKDEFYRDNLKNCKEQVSNDEIRKYIENLDIEINDKDLSFISDRLYQMFNNYDREEFYDFLKVVLIVAPRVEELSSRTLSEAIKNSKYYENIPDIFKNKIEGWFSMFAINVYQLGISLILQIIKDEKILCSYLKEKNITYTYFRKLIFRT